MKKIVKRIGRAVAITFNPEEINIYNIQVGKIFDVEISEVKEKEVIK